MNAAFSRFYRFLVESPMRFDGTYGTVHQQYRIDGKLIAVGIVDILPNGLISVYAFYDSSQHISAFGKYMSLKEIECASPNYCYLGYYIESCPKMRDKAEYKPSELLCPTTYKWVDAAKAQAILMGMSPRHHCCTLYEESYRDVTNGSNGTDERQATTLSTTEVVNQLRLDVGASTLVTLNILQGGGQAVVRPLLEKFVKEMGPELSTRFILKLV
jgi:arginine-tRNA-protein transferase